MQTTHNENKRKKVFLITTLLLALLLIFAFGTYSLSKYVSKDSGEGNATIAKWGYKVDVNTDNLFGEKYKNQAGSGLSTIAAEKDNEKIVVKASTTDSKVIAPGTTGYFTIAVEGKAEVAASLAVTLDNAKLPTLKVTVDTKTYEYKPVNFKLYEYNSSEFSGEGTLVEAFGSEKNETTTKDFGEITEYLSSEGLKNETLGPNNAALAIYYKIAWEWAFEGSSVSSTPAGASLEANTLDTLFGMYAESGEEKITYDGKDYTIATNSVTSFDLNISISLTQTQSVSS